MDTEKAGFGRPDSEKRWGANIFLQVFDPEVFSGRDDSLRQPDCTIGRCHANAPIDPEKPVRFSGEMAQQRMRDAEQYDSELSSVVLDGLLTKAEKYDVSFPAPV